MFNKNQWAIQRKIDLYKKKYPEDYFLRKTYKILSIRYELGQPNFDKNKNRAILFKQLNKLTRTTGS